MNLIQHKHPTGRGHIYYVEAVDTDSHKPAWVKVGDTHDIPVAVYAEIVYRELTQKTYPTPSPRLQP